VNGPAIRHADPARDGGACAAIYAPFVRDSVISFEAEPPDAQEMSARIEQTSVGYPWIVADRDGRAVGFAYANAHRARAAYRWAVDVSVYVDRDNHRRGLGRALYLALFELLRRQRLRIACAGITLPNEASVGLHESLGFQHVGTYRGIGWKRGAWRDVGWWQLELDGPVDGAPPEPLGPQRFPDGPCEGTARTTA
jgi:phosphinothricin acetyltransferase